MIYFSIIMPVTLEDYEGAGKNREYKFKRAVRSFLSCIFPANECELIIVSDGCSRSEEIYNENFKKKINIRFLKIDKQTTFSGNVRQFGIDNARGKYILYLDSDDVIGDSHFITIKKELDSYKEPKWVYYDDFIVKNITMLALKKVSLEKGSVGTSSICHKKDLPNVSWSGCDGYGHDWEFIKKLIDAEPNPQKIKTPYYFIHHIPNLIDF